MSTNKIAERMKEKGFVSDAALAEVVGCDRSMVTRVRLGMAEPSLKYLVRFIGALELPPDAFLRKPEDAA